MKTKAIIIFTCFSFSLMSQTPIFTNDFSDPNDWIMEDIANGGSQNWVITTNGPIGPFSGSMNPISSTTSANGFALYDSDGLNTTGTGAQNALLTYNGFVDCSSYDNININFESYHRKYQNTIYLEVTTDPNWLTPPVQFEINSTLGVTYATPNPEVVSFDISTVAANEPAVYFRFHYYGGDDYAWMIDDVSFTEIPNHFLTIDSEVFGGGLLGSGVDYTFTPISQVSSSPYKFEAAINNEGMETQHNVKLNISVKDPNLSTTSYTSSGISLPSSQTYTAAASTNFTPSTIGLHEFSYWGSSDNINSSTIVRKAMVTDSVYAVDFDWGSDGSTITGGGYQSGAACGGQVLGNTFDIYNNALVTSISFHVNSFSTSGAELKVELYDANGKTLVATSDNYILTTNDIGSWVTLQLVNPYLALSDHSYIAAVRGNQHPTNTSWISSAFATANSSSWLLDGGCNGSPGTWFTLSHSLLIRMNLPICTSSGYSSVTACETHLWDGESYTESGVYTNTFPNVLGCDSVHTLNLTITNSTTSSVDATSCDSYTWNGNTYTTTGTYTWTGVNAVDCDSIATLNFTSIGVTPIITQSGDFLLSGVNPSGTDYTAQWYNIDTETNETWLMGEDKNFSPRFDCNYILVTTTGNGCVDTTDVYFFAEFAGQIYDMKISPNPTNDLLNIKYVNERNQFVRIYFANSNGVVLDEFVSSENEMSIDISNYPSGAYYVYFTSEEHCSSAEQQISKKIILNK